MALIATYGRDRDLRRRLAVTLEARHDMAGSPSWNGFKRLVRERPATVAVVDLPSLGVGMTAVNRLTRFRASFPSMGLVVLMRRHRDPVALFRLGASGIQNLVLMDVEGVEPAVIRAVGRSLERGAVSVVMRALSVHLDSRLSRAVSWALDGVHRQWMADEFADRIGLSRPFLSECFKEAGLPSVGHFLIWMRLLHAANWLTDPGRTAESVSRQLEYANGSTFRRALRSRTGATPSEVIAGGGLVFVLRHFIGACDFDGLRHGARFSVA